MNSEGPSDSPSAYRVDAGLGEADDVAEGDVDGGGPLDIQSAGGHAVGVDRQPLLRIIADDSISQRRRRESQSQSADERHQVRSVRSRDTF